MRAKRQNEGKGKGYYLLTFLLEGNLRDKEGNMGKIAIPTLNISLIIMI